MSLFSYSFVFCFLFCILFLIFICCLFLFISRYEVFIRKASFVYAVNFFFFLRGFFIVSNGRIIRWLLRWQLLYLRFLFWGVGQSTSNAIFWLRGWLHSGNRDFCLLYRRGLPKAAGRTNTGWDSCLGEKWLRSCWYPLHLKSTLMRILVNDLHSGTAQVAFSRSTI